MFSVVCASLHRTTARDNDHRISQLRPPLRPVHRASLGNAFYTLLEANDRLCQRAASSSSSGAATESPLRLNIAAAAATAAAAGSIAWYYHLYGPTADAATPAEEG